MLEVLWLSMASAGPEAAVSVLADGKPVVVIHQEYCSFPSVAGITVPRSEPPPRPRDGGADLLFDPAGLEKRGVSGLVWSLDGQPVAAAPLALEGDGTLPTPDFERWQKVLMPCELAKVERPAHEELLRKLPPAARGLLVRLQLEVIVRASRMEDPALVAEARKEALACASGRCGDHLDRFAAVMRSR